MINIMQLLLIWLIAHFPSFTYHDSSATSWSASIQVWTNVPSSSYSYNQSHYTWEFQSFGVSVSESFLCLFFQERWGLHLCAIPLNPTVVTEPYSNNESRWFAHRPRNDLIISAQHCMLYPIITSSMTGLWGSVFLHPFSDRGGKLKMLLWH